RIDEMIVFHSLEKEHLKEIVTLMAQSLINRLKEQDITLELTDAALQKIVEEGYDPQYGARPLRRAIQKHVEDRLSEELLKGEIDKTQKIVLDFVNDEFVVHSQNSVPIN
ncbi:MAG: ATP-dependent Clp protease ATP-binding subunit ClpC, partial [Solibacillus sp.]